MADLDETGYFSEETATFGDRVQAARTALGLSEHDFAHKLGVKTKTVRGWENDLAEPRANKLQMMAGLMNVSIVWLLTGEGEGVQEPVEGVSDGDIRDILIDLRRTKAEMVRIADRMGRLEKRLVKVLSDG
jgi:transcriptional regulator with XRE-family HTH domain